MVFDIVCRMLSICDQLLFSCNLTSVSGVSGDETFLTTANVTVQQLQFAAKHRPICSRWRSDITDNTWQPFGQCGFYFLWAWHGKSCVEILPQTQSYLSLETLESNWCWCLADQADAGTEDGTRSSGLGSRWANCCRCWRKHSNSKSLWLAGAHLEPWFATETGNHTCLLFSVCRFVIVVWAFCDCGICQNWQVFVS